MQQAEVQFVCLKEGVRSSRTEMDLPWSGGRSQTPALPHRPEPEALEDLQAPQRGPGSLAPGGGTAGQRCPPPPSRPQPRSALRAAGVRAAAAGVGPTALPASPL